MTVLYVVSDQKGAGKTALCITLAHMLRQQGKAVTAFKPLETAGSGSDADADARAYAKLLGVAVEGWPTEIPSDGLSQKILDETRTAVEAISHGQDAVMIEGSASLSAKESARVADALDARVVVVASYNRNLSASELKPLTTAFGDRLVGFLINGLTRHLGTECHTRLLPDMESEGLAVLGVIPEDRRLLGVSVNQIAEHLGGEFIMDEGDTEALVEHLMVGGMGLDPGELYFGLHDNKAAIMRGDRPDLQMSALGAPTSTACMVLTNGKAPIEYVLYEAEQEEVPLIQVATDTLTTMAALNTLMERSRFDHPAKLERFAELLGEYADVVGMFQALGVA